MTILKKIKHLVKVTDFFYSTEMLRYDDDLQYKTLTGGLISLGIIITITVGFASMILNTLDLNIFITSTQVIKNAIPPSSILQITQQSYFRFGAEVYGLNLSQPTRYFDVDFYILYYNYGQVVNRTNLTLQACTRQFFKDYPDVVENFDRLQAGNWLCPVLNTTMNMYGKYSSVAYTQHIIQVRACNNDTDPSRPCASQEEIDNYIALQNQNFFYFTVYFTNTQINPDKKDYKQYYIQDQSYAIFGSNLGAETYLYFTDYTVQTDYSIWPFSNIVDDIGCLAEDIAINHPFQTNINASFITFNIAKSTNSIVYTRQVQKLSAVFSFMGGMIGAVSAVLFVIKIYTSLSFQFAIAFELFKNKQQLTNENNLILNKGEKPKENKNNKRMNFSMNFINFIRYFIYGFCKYVGCAYSWPQMEYANQCKKEILRQLDIKLLLKRIIFLEHCLTYLIDDFQLDALQLKKPQTPKQVKILRQKCESIIDHQLSQQFDMQETKGLKQNEIYIDHPVIQTPASIFSSVSNTFRDLQKSNVLQNRNINPTKQKARQVNRFMDKDVIIIQMENIKQDSSHPPSISQQIFMKNKANSRNRVKNTYKRQKVRESFLVELHKNAEAGNQMSNKIWNSLDPQTRISIINQKNFNQH